MFQTFQIELNVCQWRFCLVRNISHKPLQRTLFTLQSLCMPHLCLRQSQQAFICMAPEIISGRDASVQRPFRQKIAKGAINMFGVCLHVRPLTPKTQP